MPIMIIGKKEFNYEEKLLDQFSLSFYSDNPRVYSQMYIEPGITPTQQEIEELMTSMDHVKQLKLSIESNGGLIDPLIVRDGDFVVLEGNSRLAAYRLLARENAIKWGQVRCKILPADIDDSTIFTLLGQYHIIGRKDWSPFEQAGYLYRRHSETRLPIEYMAKELGITKGIAQKYIDVYQFMIDVCDAQPNKWSYYEEFLKNGGIKKAKEKYPNLEDTIVTLIKTGQINEASDIRKIGEMAKLEDKKSKKLFEKVANGEVDPYDAYDEMKQSGKFDDVVSKVKKIRNEMADVEFKTKILSNDDPNQLFYDIKKIIKSLEDIKKALEEKLNGN